MTLAFNRILILIILIHLIHSHSLKAQKDNFNPSLGASVNGNYEDLIVGISFYPGKMKSNMLGYLSFNWRPGQIKILEHQSGNLYHQYAERRFYLGGGVSQLLPINNSFGLYGDMNVSYSWGRYGGTYYTPDDGIVLIPGAGFLLRGRNEKSHYKIGYEYMRTFSYVSAHRLKLAIVLGSK